MTYPVIFAGAGPGDPDLITVRAQHALIEADLVIYAGSLVPQAVLKWAKPDTPKLNSASMHLGDIIREMETAHQAGRRVCGFIPEIRVFTAQFSSRCLSLPNGRFLIR